MVDEIRLHMEIVLYVSMILVQIRMIMDRVLISRLVPECSTISGFVFLSIILSMYHMVYGLPFLIIGVFTGVSLFILIMPTVKELYDEWYTCILFIVWPMYGLSLYGKLRIYG